MTSGAELPAKLRPNSSPSLRPAQWAAPRARATLGRDIYQQRCQGCIRSIVLEPVRRSLPESPRLTAEQFSILVHSGRGEMPAFGDLDSASTAAL